MLSTSAIIGTIVFLYGLVFGSFLNVCIYRLPRGESVVRPRSRCPGCGNTISAWRNIPIVSFLLLRGRCGSCGSPISWRYPAVELLTGLLLVALYFRFGLTSCFIVNALFVCLVVVLVFTDLDRRILPDILTKGGLVAGILLSPLQDPSILGMELLPESFPDLVRQVGNPVLSSLAGVLFGAGFLWSVAWLYLKIRKIEGMGFGDIKMIAMIGAFLGWQLTWLTILLGSLLGAVLGGGYMVVGKFWSDEEDHGDSGSGLSRGAKRKVVEKIDINLASAEELQKLPGVGPDLAERIIDFGLESGPYKRKTDLLGVEGIGQREYELLRDRITARFLLPFGTFLGIAAIAAAFFGPDMIEWYFSRLVN